MCCNAQFATISLCALRSSSLPHLHQLSPTRFAAMSCHTTILLCSLLLAALAAPTAARTLFLASPQSLSGERRRLQHTPAGPSGRPPAQVPALPPGALAHAVPLPSLRAGRAVVLSKDVEGQAPQRCAAVLPLFSAVAAASQRRPLSCKEVASPPSLPHPGPSLLPLPHPPPRRLLTIRTDAGERVAVQATEAQLKGITTGMRVTVAAAGGATNKKAGAGPVVAAKISASGAPFSAPRLTVLRGNTAAAAAAAPLITRKAVAATTTTSTTLSTNALIDSSLSTLFVPSECLLR